MNISQRMKRLATGLLIFSCAPGVAHEDGAAPTDTVPSQPGRERTSEEQGLYPFVSTQEAGSGGSGDFETTIRVRRPVTAASSSTIRERDLKIRPVKRPGDILQVTPGLFVVQHAGGGKSNQYFLRGYDADHGTDVAIFVDGIPVNQVSHGHGQGYADLHWLIPETVDRIEVLKGTYFPHLGDFATAGGINIITHRTLPYNQATLSGGMFGTVRALAIATEEVAGITPLIAAEVYSTDGPFISPERTRRYNFLGKFTKDLSSSSSLSVGLTGYGGRWNASGQIPQREVEAGRLDRFGTIDSSEGGDSDRYSLFSAYQYYPTEDSKLTLSAFAAYYRLDMFSNFTFFSANPADGDQIQQRDNRTTLGADASYKFINKWEGTSLETTVGLQGRNDDISNALNNTKGREFRSRVRENDVKQRSIAVHANEEITWAPWLRSATGIRADHFYFDVRDRATSTDLGVKDASLLSPKASLIFTPLAKTDLFLNYGQGFHSNDARGVADGAKPLNKVYGYEAGARTKLLGDRIDLAGAFFLQYADEELVYVGDAGGTEIKGPSRRYGGEIEARVRLLEWLFVDTDVNLIKPELRGLDSTESAIPYAPTRIVTAGVSVQHPEGYFGRLGVFHIADRPASEDRFFTADGFTRFDATLGYRQKRYELSLAIQNIFNTKWREAQFTTTSRLSNETGLANCPAGTKAGDDGNGNFTGCEDIHFTPGNPINLQASATVFF